MKTIFGLFETYGEAQAAVEALLEQGIESDEINAIVQKGVAKSAMDVNLEQAGVAVTDEVGERTLEGLNALVASEKALSVPGVGEIYTAGEVATLMGAAAMRGPEEESGLGAALREFDVPASYAAAYQDAIAGSGVLLFVRAEDEKALDSRRYLEKHGGQITIVGD
jgi:hypothetical protein